MDFKDIKTSTFRECQRHLFVQSLYRELDKAVNASENRNASLAKMANKFMFEDGLSKDACVDSLIIEGFPGDVSRQYVESMAAVKDFDKEDYKYDYCFEDHKGRIFTGRELNELVEASTDSQADSMIKKILSAFDPPVNLLSITRVS